LVFDILKNKDTGEVTHIFKASKCIGMDSTYVGNLNIAPKGNPKTCLKDFQRFMQDEIYGTPLELSVITGLSSVLVGFLNKEVQCSNLVTSLYGTTSMGKSTFATVAVSMGADPFDKPTEGQSLFFNFHGTDNEILARLVGNHGITVVFDESTKYKGKDLVHLAYCMEDGTEKGRLTREGKTQPRGKYNTSIILTGEMPICGKGNQNAGQGVRIMEYGNILWTRDGNHSKRVKDFALNNYGWQTPCLAKYVIKKGKPYVLKLFEANRDVYLSKSKSNDACTHRMSIRYSLLLTTLQLANECMGLNLSYDYVLNMLVENEYTTSDNRNIGKKSYDYLVQLFNSHPDKFSVALNRNLILDARGETWGIQDPQRDVLTSVGGNYRTIIWFSELKFKELLEKKNFESAEVVLACLKKHEYLDCPSDRYYRERKITAKGSHARVYGIKLYDSSDVDSKQELKQQLHDLDMLKKQYYDEKTTGKDELGTPVKSSVHKTKTLRKA
jgi:hypothetical protein